MLGVQVELPPGAVAVRLHRLRVAQLTVARGLRQVVQEPSIERRGEGALQAHVLERRRLEHAGVDQSDEV